MAISVVDPNLKDVAVGPCERQGDGREQLRRHIRIVRSCDRCGASTLTNEVKRIDETLSSDPAAHTEFHRNVARSRPSFRAAASSAHRSTELWGTQQATIARHREDRVLHYLKEIAQRLY